MVDASPWLGRNVLITGHTGFKGAWLALILHDLGARVHGLALDPQDERGIFGAARIGELLASDTRGDVRDAGLVCDCIRTVQPEIVFHLAAQPLVRASYELPVETYAVNVMGTAHVLEAVRQSPSVRAALVVTTDKCYENREWVHPYRESDRLGGFDPYSNSKACAELLTQSFRDSFFATPEAARIASARAGNVIGGGDWAPDRLVPDCIRAWCSGDTLSLRHPQAVRPWQHVLESLTGYLLLAQHLLSAEGAAFAKGWNFGPRMEDDSPVGEVARRVCDSLGITLQLPTTAPDLHEAGLLRLDSSLARLQLGWQPAWSLERTLDETIAWYRQWRDGADMLAFSRAQIVRHREAAQGAGSAHE